MSELGHDISVIYSGPKNTKAKKNYNHNYKCFFVPYIGYPITGKLRQLNSITILKKVKTFSKSNKIDIVNSVGSESLFLPRLCQKNNIKFVISIEHPNLKAVKPNFRLNFPFKYFINLARSRVLQIIKYTSRLAHAVITPSVFTKIQANSFFGVPYSKIKVINHGVAENFETHREKINQRNILGPIIFFGRLEPQKGVDLLIQAYYKVVQTKIIKSQKLIIIGRGPFENYRDRKSAANVGLYSNTVADHYVPYVRPQENGYKTDTRWFSLSDDNNQGLLVEAEKTLGFSVHHNLQKDFIPPVKIAITSEDGPGARDNKKRVNVHVNDIKPRDLISVNIDFGQMGVGGDDSWGKHTLRRYSLTENQYQYAFWLRFKHDGSVAK